MPVPSTGVWQILHRAPIPARGSLVCCDSESMTYSIVSGVSLCGPCQVFVCLLLFLFPGSLAHAVVAVRDRASYSIAVVEAQALEFDLLGRLIIGQNNSIIMTSNGQTKVTLPNVTPVYMNVGKDGSFAYAGYNNASQVFQVDGRVVTISTSPYQSLGIAISP